MSGGARDIIKPKASDRICPPCLLPFIIIIALLICYQRPVMAQDSAGEQGDSETCGEGTRTVFTVTGEEGDSQGAAKVLDGAGDKGVVTASGRLVIPDDSGWWYYSSDDAPAVTIKNTAIFVNAGHVETEKDGFAAVRVTNENEGAGACVELRRGGQFATRGKKSHAVHSDRDDFIFIMQDGQIETGGRAAHGFYSEGDRLVFRMLGGQILTVTDASHGFYSTGDRLVFRMLDGQILTRGRAAHGFYSTGDRLVFRMLDGQILTRGRAAHGFYSTGDRLVFRMSGGQITTERDNSDAIRLALLGDAPDPLPDGDKGYDHLVEIGPDADLITKGVNSHAIHFEDDKDGGTSRARVVIAGDATVEGKDAVAVLIEDTTGGVRELVFRGRSRIRAIKNAKTAIDNRGGLPLPLTVRDNTEITGAILTGEGDDTFTLRDNAQIFGTVNMGIGANMMNIQGGQILTVEDAAPGLVSEGERFTHTMTNGKIETQGDAAPGMLLKGGKQAKPRKTYLVLNLEGGGTRGLLGAQFLKLLEDELEEKTGKTIPEIFDAFSGVGIGGINALFLASDPEKLETGGNTAKDLVNIYSPENTRELFKETEARQSKVGFTNSFRTVAKVPVGINPEGGMEYFMKNIHTFPDFIKKYFFNVKGLNPVYGDSKKKFLEKMFRDARLKDLKKPALVSAFEYVRKEAVYFSKKNPRKETDNMPVSDAADATSAVPLYFDLAKFDMEGETQYFMDGGLMTNNLCHSMLQEIENKHRDRELPRIIMLSLGSGMSKANAGEGDAEARRTGGAYQQYKELPNTLSILATAPAANALAMCKKTLGEDFMHVSLDNEKTPGLRPDIITKLDKETIQKYKEAAETEFKRKRYEVLKLLLPEILRRMRPSENASGVGYVNEFTMSGGQVLTKGLASHGLDLEGERLVFKMSGGQISTEGDNSDAIRLTLLGDAPDPLPDGDKGYDHLVEIGPDADLITEGVASHALHFKDDKDGGTSRARVVIAGDATVKGKDAVAVLIGDITGGIRELVFRGRSRIRAIENAKTAIDNRGGLPLPLTVRDNTEITGDILTGAGDDTFTLRDNAQIFGTVNMGKGANTMNIESGKIETQGDAAPGMLLKGGKQAKPRKTYLVLNLEGGGTRGLLGAQFLKLLEDELEEKTGKTIPEIFDAFSGVSIGGINALFLASDPEKLETGSNTAEDLVKIYSPENTRELFKETKARPSKTSWTDSFKTIAKVPVGINPEGFVRYVIENIHTFPELVKKFTLGIKGTSTVYGDSKKKFLEKMFRDARLKDLKKPALVSAFEYVRKEAVYFSKNNPRKETDNMRVSDIADATSAVQLYFNLPKFDMGGETRYFTDGSIVVNNLCHSMLQEIENKHREVPRIIMLSLGSAMSRANVAEGDAEARRTAGVYHQYKELPNTFSIIASALSANAVAMCKKTLGEDFMHVSLDNEKTPLLRTDIITKLDEKAIQEFKDAAGDEFERKKDKVLKLLMPEILRRMRPAEDTSEDVQEPDTDRFTMSGGQVITKGRASHGYSSEGKRLVFRMSGGQFLTKGPASHGFFYEGDRLVFRMPGGTILTEGDNSDAIHLVLAGDAPTPPDHRIDETDLRYLAADAASDDPLPADDKGYEHLVEIGPDADLITEGMASHALHFEDDKDGGTSRARVVIAGDATVKGKDAIVVLIEDTTGGVRELVISGRIKAIKDAKTAIDNRSGLPLALTVRDNAQITGAILTGGGDDTFILRDNARITGNIDMGPGHDSLELGGNARITGKITMGAGNDTLTFRDNSAIHGVFAPGADRKATTVIDMGPGDDTVTLVALTNLPFGTIDGGEGGEVRGDTIDLSRLIPQLLRSREMSLDIAWINFEHEIGILDDPSKSDPDPLPPPKPEVKEEKKVVVPKGNGQKQGVPVGREAVNRNQQGGGEGGGHDPGPDEGEEEAVPESDGQVDGPDGGGPEAKPEVKQSEVKEEKKVVAPKGNGQKQGVPVGREAVNRNQQGGGEGGGHDPGPDEGEEEAVPESDGQVDGPDGGGPEAKPEVKQSEVKEEKKVVAPKGNGQKQGVPVDRQVVNRNQQGGGEGGGPDEGEEGDGEAGVEEEEAAEEGGPDAPDGREGEKVVNPGQGRQQGGQDQAPRRRRQLIDQQQVSRYGPYLVGINLPGQPGYAPGRRKNVVTINPTGQAVEARALSTLTDALHDLVERRLGGNAARQRRAGRPLRVAASERIPGLWFRDRRPYAWGQEAFGIYQRRSRDGFASAYTLNQKGVAFGIEQDFRGERSRLGLLFGYARGSFRTRPASVSTDSDSFFAGIYGRHRLDDYYVQGALNASYSKHRNRRQVLVFFAASSDYSSWGLSPALTLGRVFRLNSQFSLEPSVDLRYSVGFYDAYREKGLSHGMLSIDSRTQQSLSGRLNLAGIYEPPDESGSVTLRLGLSHRRLFASDLEGRVSDQAFKFRSAGSNNVTLGHAGVDIAVNLTEALSLNGRYEYSHSIGTISDRSNSGHLSLVYRF